MSLHRHTRVADGPSLIPRWRGEAGTAYLVPARGSGSRPAIERVLARAVAEGFHAAVTAALSPEDQEPFLAAGFVVHERLHLLERSVDDMPSSPPVVLRRARRSDRTAILAVDGAAFSPFWHLDEDGLDDALGATPSSRMRVATPGPDDGTVVGYAVTGRAASRGYLQRLAVDPSRQRLGLGTALVVDGLRWLRRWGAREVLVNTQEDNVSALALYEALGFRRRSDGLAVLRCDLVAGTK